MGTVHHCRGSPGPARRCYASAPADPGRPRGLTPGGPLPTPCCRLARRTVANSRRAPSAAGQPANGEMAARRFRRLIFYCLLPPTVVRACYAGCSNHLKRNAAH